MAVMTIPLLGERVGRPLVVEIPIEDPVDVRAPRAARVKKEPVSQKNNRIAPGHEGRRRRRREDMQRLLDCPQRVEPSLEDWYPGSDVSHRSFSWNQLTDIDSTGKIVETKTQRKVHHNANRLPRALRQELKKVHVSPAFVHGIEKEVRDMIDPSLAEPEYEVIDSVTLGSVIPDGQTKRSVHIAIDAPSEKASSYSRYWIHMISRYYQLHSYSQDYQNRRVACIDIGNKKLPSTWLCDIL